MGDVRSHRAYDRNEGECGRMKANRGDRDAAQYLVFASHCEKRRADDRAAQGHGHRDRLHDDEGPCGCEIGPGGPGE